MGHNPQLVRGARPDHTPGKEIKNDTCKDGLDDPDRGGRR